MKSWLFILFCLLPPLVGATTYYVDFASGNNASAGTSQGTAWKNFPGTALNYDFSTFITGSGWPAGKIQPGDIIKVKSGTTYQTNGGFGMVRISTTHYSTAATVANPILIQRDTTWSSGAVTFDGTGMDIPTSGFGLFHATIGGITWDGVTTEGFVFQNSPWRGLSSYTTASRVEGISAYYCLFYNCGTATPDDGTAATEGSIAMNNVTNGVVAYCRINGNGRHMNGIAFSDGGFWANNVFIHDCVITNHNCTDVVSGDWGIGVKCYNGSITVSNCTLAYNFKGADNGLHNDGIDQTYKYISNLIYSNFQAGLNGNGGAVLGRTNIETFYEINNTIHGNGTYGSYFYGGEMYLYIIGNLFHNNNIDDIFDGANLVANNSSDGLEQAVFFVRAYNNIFYKQGGGVTRWNFQCQRWKIGSLPTNLTYEWDWNCFVQASSEPFAYIGSFVGASDNTAEFFYGANGPGHASGNWYDYYGGTAVAPTNGSLGHFHSDVHSKGTGASDTNLPPFLNPTINDYSLTTTYPGTNLTARSWYISEMGNSADGTARYNWDIGPNDVSLFILRRGPQKIRGVRFNK